MELNELKENWQNAGQELSNGDHDFHKILKSQLDTPLSILKTKYIRQLILIPLAILVLILANMLNFKLHNNGFIWLTIFILFLLCLDYYRNYSSIIRIQRPPIDSVRETLKKNLSFLERNARQQMFFMRLILLMFVAILEAVMYLGLAPDYQFWQSVLLPLRILFYITVVILQPYFSRYIYNLNFGRYIYRLKELLNQTD